MNPRMSTAARPPACYLGLADGLLPSGWPLVQNAFDIRKRMAGSGKPTRVIGSYPLQRVSETQAEGQIACASGPTRRRPYTGSFGRSRPGFGLEEASSGLPSSTLISLALNARWSGMRDALFDPTGIAASPRPGIPAATGLVLLSTLGLRATIGPIPRLSCRRRKGHQTPSQIATLSTAC
jgi:hypothetical protein